MDVVSNAPWRIAMLGAKDCRFLLGVIKSTAGVRLRDSFGYIVGYICWLEWQQSPDDLV